MPQANRFRHQLYTTTVPTSPHHLLRPGVYPNVGSEEFHRRMQAVGDSLRAAEVTAVYLVHGTFVGSDMLGFLAELSRVLPSVGQPARRTIKRLIDRLTDDQGNYTESYARLFAAALHRPGVPRIPVRLFHWSSENHHLGRADGAVRLIDELASLDPTQHRRILLWGHSHAGNLFALMSNLLAGSRETVEAFFAAAEVYYRWPIVGCVDIPVWDRVRSRFQAGRPIPEAIALDMVTFGTPIRYGWDSGGYARLLHFINHRPIEGLPAYLAAFPPKLANVLRGAEGDYVQQLGIAGTNTMPSLFAWRAWLADSRLNRLLQSESVEESLAARFQAGAIVPEEGTTLLVDYGRPKGTVAKHHAGHAVYTRKEWLLFHAEEVVRQFYPAASRGAA